MKCGYDLQGLRKGVRCPECGTVSRSGRKIKLNDNLTDAPVGYLRMLTLGLGLVSLGVLGYIIFLVITALDPFPPALEAAVRLMVPPATAASWWFGMHLVLRPRPVQPSSYRDPILDSRRLRKLNLSLQSVVACAVIFFAIYLAMPANNAGWQTFRTVLLVITVLLGIAALVSFVPISVYLASLCDWAGEESLGDRLRAVAWTITVCGGLSLMCYLLGVLGLRGLILIGALLFVIASIAATIFLLSTVQLAYMSLWALQNSAASRERDQRLAERKAAEAEDQRRREEARLAALAATSATPPPTPEPELPADDSAIPLANDPASRQAGSAEIRHAGEGITRRSRETLRRPAPLPGAGSREPPQQGRAADDLSVPLDDAADEDTGRSGEAGR